MPPFPHFLHFLHLAAFLKTASLALGTNLIGRSWTTVEASYQSFRLIRCLRDGRTGYAALRVVPVPQRRMLLSHY
jgi:hypothetical protein